MSGPQLAVPSPRWAASRWTIVSGLGVSSSAWVAAAGAAAQQSTYVTPNGSKAHAGDAIQYVSPAGSDTSDGLSWGSAQRTITAADSVATLMARPGGRSPASRA